MSSLYHTRLTQTQLCTTEFCILCTPSSRIKPVYRLKKTEVTKHLKMPLITSLKLRIRAIKSVTYALKTKTEKKNTIYSHIL